MTYIGPRNRGMQVYAAGLPLLAGAAFAPTDISGLQLWFAPRLESYANNDPVSALADRSGNGNNATQASGTLQPLFITNQVNGKAIVRPDGTDDYLQTGSNIALTGDFTIWWVAKVTNLGGARVIYGRSGTGNPLIDQGSSTAVRLRNDAGTLVSLTHTAILNTTYYIIEVVRSGSSLTRYVNGSADGTATLSGTITLNQFLIRDTTSSPFVGDMGDSGIYSVALDSTQRANLEGYLNGIYALY